MMYEDISDVDMAEYEDSRVVKITEIKKRKIPCTKCSMTFLSEKALQIHARWKHLGKDGVIKEKEGNNNDNVGEEKIESTTTRTARAAIRNWAQDIKEAERRYNVCVIKRLLALKHLQRAEGRYNMTVDKTLVALQHLQRIKHEAHLAQRRRYF